MLPCSNSSSDNSDCRHWWHAHWDPPCTKHFMQGGSHSVPQLDIVTGIGAGLRAWPPDRPLRNPTLVDPGSFRYLRKGARGPGLWSQFGGSWGSHFSLHSDFRGPCLASGHIIPHFLSCCCPSTCCSLCSLNLKAHLPHSISPPKRLQKG